MTLQQAFDLTKKQYPDVVDCPDNDDSGGAGHGGFWQRWSLVDAAAESGDPSRRGQLVLHELRFTRCYEHDSATDDRYEAEMHPRNHWGFMVPATDFVDDREAARSRAWVEYAGSTPIWEV